MFKIQVAPNTDVSGGSIPVSWCIDAETATYLVESRVPNPHVVIVVSPVNNYHPSKEYRKVVPLKDLMTYVEFHSAGPNKIWAFISIKDKLSQCRDSYLSRTHRVYDTDLLSSDGDEFLFFRFSATERTLLYSEPLQVEVPQQIFAKDPPQWEQEWVNHFFRSLPLDQCDYRRRRLFAYGVQPFILLGNLFVRLCLLFFGFLYLSRGLTFKYLLHPLTYNLSEAIHVMEGSWLVPVDKEVLPKMTFRYVFSKMWKFIFMPWFIILTFVCWLGHCLIIPAILVMAVFLACCVISFVEMERYHPVAKFLTNLFRRRARVVSPSDYWYMDDTEAITCSPTDQVRTSVNALPPKYRTIRLRISELKSKVCRPFSA